MGCNFYWNLGFNVDGKTTWYDPKKVKTVLPTREETSLHYFTHDTDKHLGKRSAAGHYCWDCQVTLCKGGPSKIHYSCEHPIGCNCRWYDKCPHCGKESVKEGLDSGAIARELGFDKSKPRARTGVSSCSSFSWGLDPEKVKEICRKHGDDNVVINEYGDVMTGYEFLKELELNCPIQYTELIGNDFS